MEARALGIELGWMLYPQRNPFTPRIECPVKEDSRRFGYNAPFTCVP